MVQNKGDVIERVVRTKIGISELSRILNVSRTSIYNWFEHGHLSLETISKIGQAINHDFANEFPEEFAKAKNVAMADPIPDKKVDNGNQDSSVQHWMNKYITLLEKYNELLIEIGKPDSKKEDSKITGSTVINGLNTIENIDGRPFHWEQTNRL